MQRASTRAPSAPSPNRVGCDHTGRIRIRAVEPQRFTGTLADSGRGGGRWVEVPFDPKSVFGQSRAPVKGTVNGTPLRSRLAVYGGRTYLGLRSEVRAAAGLDVGDRVEVVLELDDEPREVTIPPELDAALTDDARAAFDALAFTHRREYAEWVGEAKRAETRSRRAQRAVEMLREGIRHP
jgi:bacteriocin resistance YdeI/OmpD-like protein/uncharacterized protein DUF1905